MMKRVLVLFNSLIFTVVVFAQQPVDYLLKSKALTDNGKARDAIVLLSEALSKLQDNRFYLQRADAYMAVGDYSNAITDLQSANRISAAAGEYGLSRIYALKGDVKTSLYHLDLNLSSSFKKSEKEIMLDPAFSVIENTPDWRQFWKKERYDIFEKKIPEIEYYISTGNREEANSILSELINGYPENNSTLYAKALVDFSTQKYAEAITILTKLTSSDRKNETWLRLMAKTQVASGNQAGASLTYSLLIDLGVADAKLLLNRAECYRKTGEYDKAIKDLSGFLELYPDNKEALSLTGKTEAESGDNLKALDYFSKNLKLHPNDPDCYVDRANSYFISKTWDYAISDYSMALDIQPADPEVWLNKGIALLNAGKADDACHDFRKALSLGNKKATSYISRNCLK
jgi:tetratricopeptide (TPR) repeat protein